MAIGDVGKVDALPSKLCGWVFYILRLAADRVARVLEREAGREGERGNRKTAKPQIFDF